MDNGSSTKQSSVSTSKETLASSTQTLHDEPRQFSTGKLVAAADGRDIICGIVMAIFGATVAIYVPSNYALGTLSQIRTGALPTAMGVLLTLFGLLIVIPALRRRGSTPTVEWRPLLTILGSVLVFLTLIETVGLVPAIIGMTIVSSLADKKLTLIKSIVLAVSLSALAVAIFYFALDVPLKLFKWDW